MAKKALEPFDNLLDSARQPAISIVSQYFCNFPKDPPSAKLLDKPFWLTQKTCFHLAVRQTYVIRSFVGKHVVASFSSCQELPGPIAQVTQGDIFLA